MMAMESKASADITQAVKDIQKFFDTMPKLKHEITIKNPKTKKESKIILNGLNDFFG